MRAAVPSSSAAEAVATETAADADAARGRARGGGRWVEAAIAAAAYVAVSVWTLWPLPALVATHGPHFPGPYALVDADFDLISWSLAWDAHAVATAPWDLFRANIFHPSPSALAYSEHFLGLLPLYAPAYWLTGNPALARNLLLIVLQPLCALALFALARRWVSAPAAFVGGFLYGFAPGYVGGLAHFHIAAVAYMPLVLLFGDRFCERGRAADAAALSVFFALQAAVSFYLAYALVFACVAWFPFVLWRWRDRLDLRRCAGLALAAAGSGAILVALALPYLRLRELGLIPGAPGDFAVLPFGLWPDRVERSIERFFSARSVGPIGYALAAIAIAPRWRGRASVTLAALALVLVGFVAAHGPTLNVGPLSLWTPYPLLVDWVPGFAAVRMPARFVAVAHLGLALLATLGASRILAPIPARIAAPAAAALAAAALLSFSPTPPLALEPEPVGRNALELDRWLAAHGDGRPLLEHPAVDFRETARRMVRSTVHWLPIVDGYSGYPPPTPRYLHLLANELPAEAALQRLVDTVDLGWLVVHLDRLSPARQRRWGAPPPGLQLVRRFGDALLFRVLRRGDPARQQRLLSPTQSLEGAPLAPLGDDCPGSIEVWAPPAPWPGGKTVHVEVTITNRGDRPWPGLAFVPRHAVRIFACVGVWQTRCTAAPRLLPGDVPPGGSVRMTIPIKAPTFVGEHDVRIWLGQGGDGSLERCGVAPVRLPIRSALPLA